MNYKSGDLVKITGNRNHHQFSIGEAVRLMFKSRGEEWRAESMNGFSHWYVMESDMTPAKPATMPQKIIITTDGKITLARLFDGKTVVKRAEAKCAPSDTFDFGVGAELAVKRLMGAKPVTEPIKSESVKLYCVKSYKPGEWFTKGKVYETDCKDNFTADDGYQPHGHEWGGNYTLGGMPWSYYLVPLTRRPAKVGEWVYIVDADPAFCNWYNGNYKNGDVMRITSLPPVDRRGSGVMSGKNYMVHSEYLVLDGYHGDPT